MSAASSYSIPSSGSRRLALSELIDQEEICTEAEKSCLSARTVVSLSTDGSSCSAGTPRSDVGEDMMSEDKQSHRRRHNVKTRILLSEQL